MECKYHTCPWNAWSCPGDLLHTHIRVIDGDTININIDSLNLSNGKSLFKL
jgi:hypothetical protein